MPTEEQLAALAASLRVPSVRYRWRLERGLGCTMDVLDLEDVEPAVLRRHGPRWQERGMDGAAREYGVLRLVRGPTPDVGEWVPARHALGETTITVESARAKHAAMIEEALAEAPR